MTMTILRRMLMRVIDSVEGGKVCMSNRLGELHENGNV